MNVAVHPNAAASTAAAADSLGAWLAERARRACTLMLAGGNTPLPLYAEIARRKPDVSQVTVFALDEYVGVPVDEPRTCAGLLRRSAASAWGIPEASLRTVSSDPVRALASVQEHERRIEAAGGIDLIVLGLGLNGHLGFNEPGSPRDSGARVVPLDHTSIEANRRWFGGDYAPDHGVTVGLRTILSARRVLILAHGAAKAGSVAAMVEGPRGETCPASWLQDHPDAHVFVDEAAAAQLRSKDAEHRG